MITVSVTSTDGLSVGGNLTIRSEALDGWLVLNLRITRIVDGQTLETVQQ